MNEILEMMRVIEVNSKVHDELTLHIHADGSGCVAEATMSNESKDELFIFDNIDELKRKLTMFAYGKME